LLAVELVSALATETVLLVAIAIAIAKSAPWVLEASGVDPAAILPAASLKGGCAAAVPSIELDWATADAVLVCGPITKGSAVAPALDTTLAGPLGGLTLSPKNVLLS
jgi:hypothetical protein